jgi:hypothetical protein
MKGKDMIFSRSQYGWNLTGKRVRVVADLGDGLKESEGVVNRSLFDNIEWKIKHFITLESENTESRIVVEERERVLETCHESRTEKLVSGNSPVIISVVESNS